MYVGVGVQVNDALHLDLVLAAVGARQAHLSRGMRRQGEEKVEEEACTSLGFMCSGILNTTLPCTHSER